jgi:hypothetical protein
MIAHDPEDEWRPLSNDPDWPNPSDPPFDEFRDAVDIIRQFREQAAAALVFPIPEDGAHRG